MNETAAVMSEASAMLEEHHSDSDDEESSRALKEVRIQATSSARI